jgi:hypothetical protein
MTLERKTGNRRRVLRTALVALSACGTASMVSLDLATVASGSSPRSECEQWNVGGTWTEMQSNGIDGTFTFEQSGTHLTGNAVQSPGSGTITGTLDREDIKFTVAWSYGKRGKYIGKIKANGSMNGTTSDEDSSARWSATGPGTCSVR